MCGEGDEAQLQEAAGGAGGGQDPGERALLAQAAQEGEHWAGGRGWLAVAVRGWGWFAIGPGGGGVSLFVACLGGRRVRGCAGAE